jgi:hypothetical protein
MKQNEFRQYLSDKLKKMNQEGEIWLSWSNHRIKAIPISKYEHGCHECLPVIFKDKGKITMGTLISQNKNRFKITPSVQGFNANPEWIRSYVSQRNILAVILETHEEKNDIKQ